MKSVFCVSMLSLVLAASAVAQTPSVPANAILNSASYAYVGLPNSGIAQGSIFTMFGSNIGPASSPPLSYPLQTNLGGVSIKVTSGGTVVDVIPIFVSPGQINAILPSSTPVGAGTLTVTYNSATSASTPIQVVANSFGIYARNSQGSGPGIITDANYKVLDLNSSAKPNDIDIIWGTGLGASAGDDATGPPKQTDMPNLPLTVYVGAFKANVLYRGRGCCNGEDQINFQIPAGVTGCHVPVVVQIGTVVSNFVTMPIATGGGTCSDPAGPSPTDLSNFLLNGGSFGSVSLTRSTNASPAIGPLPASTSTSDSGSAIFYKYTAQQLAQAQNPFQVLTIGACVVYTFTGQAATGGDPTKSIGLDAGTQITVNGPNGIKQLTQLGALGKGFYSASLGGGTPPNATPLYLDAGSYAISGPGGADVGAFNLNLTMPPNLTWTNMSSVDTVVRANGQLITWTGGDPNGNVSITGSSFKLGSNPNGSDAVGAIFICTAPDSAGQFTIPAPVLLSLPPSSSFMGFNIPGSLSISSATQPVKITATGLDYAYGSTSVSAGKGVTYQ
ncbi:MAG TPA: hypothetical protein VH157_12550 [Bryobacteraceae bacterium]|jgi:uncharacterized protein (TIGR03437 family)|nr:hypothetical protein [Bryobacteraceae bacterium]